MSAANMVERAWRSGAAVPAFNIPYLPMVEPVVKALRDANSVGMITVARLEWEKFGSGSLEAVRDEYLKHQDQRHTMLHLDHVPVIDEDNRRVDFLEIIRRAIKAGYESVMVDGSRLPLEENIACTREIVELAHASGIPVEAELGAVMGHETGPLPPYEELFVSGRGFTDPDEASRFVDSTGVDWLSVAIGNIHGAISSARHKTKVAARLNIEHLDRISREAGVPLVLHGGTGISKEYIVAGIRHGIAKINIATAIRQPYERAITATGSVEAAQAAVHSAALALLCEEIEVKNTADICN